jgi:DNA methylase/ParB/Sulfiredoxin domain
LNPQLVPIAGCKPLGREARKHSAQQVRKLAASLSQFGFVVPIVTDPELRVVAGWGLVLGARQLGLTEVPAVCLADLSEAELRVLRLALNRIAEDSGWDRQALTLEFSEILELAPKMELELTGFEIGEIDTVLGEGGDIEEEDELPPIDSAAAPVTRPGDLWVLDGHIILCGDPLTNESYARLLGDDKADLVFADLTIPITAGNLSGFGAAEHADFSMAGKPFSAGLVNFLQTSLSHAASYSADGAIHFVCMDWPHTKELITAGERIYSEWKDLCVWTNSNTGTGSIYDAGHELIFVFKVGTAPHVSNVSHGRSHQNRRNLWNYSTPIAVNSTSKSKVTLTAIKPVAMIADAIRDCCNRGGLILDPFGGVGTTLVAAERTGRRARLIEHDPVLVDLSVERWQRLTAGTARRADSGQLFQDYAAVQAR